MNLQHFPIFMRANFPEIRDESNEALLEVGTEFKKYLQDKFAGKEATLEKIWDIDPKTVIMNQVNKNPFLVNGYDPVLVLHFTEFIKIVMQQAQESSPSHREGVPEERGGGREEK